jgi:N-acetylneuraminic acid mutarotase
MKKIFFTLLLCLSVLGIYAQNYTWTNMPSLGQTLYGTASFTIGDNIYVIGG